MILFFSSSESLSGENDSILIITNKRLVLSTQVSYFLHFENHITDAPDGGADISAAISVMKWGCSKNYFEAILWSCHVGHNVTVKLYLQKRFSNVNIIVIKNH